MRIWTFSNDATAKSRQSMFATVDVKNNKQIQNNNIEIDPYLLNNCVNQSHKEFLKSVKCIKFIAIRNRKNIQKCKI